MVKSWAQDVPSCVVDGVARRIDLGKNTDRKTTRANIEGIVRGIIDISAVNENDAGCRWHGAIRLYSEKKCVGNAFLCSQRDDEFALNFGIELTLIGRKSEVRGNLLGLFLMLR